MIEPDVRHLSTALRIAFSPANFLTFGLYGLGAGILSLADIIEPKDALIFGGMHFEVLLIFTFKYLNVQGIKVISPITTDCKIGDVHQIIIINALLQISR